MACMHGVHVGTVMPPGTQRQVTACGKQKGMPPEMGFDLSNLASGRTYSTSSPDGCFQEVTTAPNK